MNYLEVKEKLEASKLELLNRMNDPNVVDAEKERLQRTIANYEYMIELTDMNQFERGKVIH
ncbi:DUF3896 family protein [Bacillus sp. ISL-47]|uniref:DUF3896 family protein n=1 Tax=Bacillus sp. ISL-47 TaxID=2819130 RepID=UPI001BE90988|nr:DUF3896 family protein [Bacillus sp. ISL-47]MBT2688792.1 DUF3896 family protein [Bacillus sp. ISL-47]